VEIATVNIDYHIELDQHYYSVPFRFLRENHQQPGFLQMGSDFKDPMTTAAAIDRVVHHSVILELNVPSYRAETAQRARRSKASRTEAEPKQSVEGQVSWRNPSGRLIDAPHRRVAMSQETRNQWTGKLAV
jgi:hypothetical protein